MVNFDSPNKNDNIIRQISIKRQKCFSSIRERNSIFGLPHLTGSLFVSAHAKTGLLRAETFHTLCETVLDNASHSSLKCLWLSGSKVSKAGCVSCHHPALLCQGDDPGEGALISACIELRWGHSPVMIGLMCPWETFTVTM